MKPIIRLLFLTMTASTPILSQAAAAPGASLILNADQPGPVINRNIYGHFAEHLGHCIYEGFWVGEDSDIPNTRGIRNDVVEALRQLNIPVLRWPGGCFADEYHWKDGIGPKEDRPSMINTHWGQVVENNHFGTHEFMDLVEMLGCDAYICGNVGSGSVQEMMEWVEYLTSDADSPMVNLRRKNGRDKPWAVRYFGVGNESWGCGGNMRPEYYADLYRRYNTFVKNYDRKNPIQRVAGGANSFDLNWTRVLMERIPIQQMNGLSLHYYTLPTGNWSKKGSATEFTQDEWFSTLKSTLRMKELIRDHGVLMDEKDPGKTIGMVVDEWGTWYDVEPGTNPGFLYQQNTLRDAIVAGLNFHIFQEHADRVSMANIAQTANVLQAMVLTDGGKMIRTPTYHVFEMYKVHQDATFLPVELQTPDYRYGDDSIPAISASASRNSSGLTHLSLVNTDPVNAITVACTINGSKSTSVAGRILTADTMNAHNTFDRPDLIQPEVFDGASIDTTGNQLTVTVPAKSVIMLEL